jgi:hypothetical protein
MVGKEAARRFAELPVPCRTSVLRSVRTDRQGRAHHPGGPLVPQTDEQQTQPVRYAYVARTRLKVGDGWREPGQEVPEAAEWPTLHAYLDLGQIEQVPVVGDQLPQLPQRPIDTFAPEGYDEVDQAGLRRLQEEQEYEQRTGKLPGEAERHPGPGRIEVSCTNCRGGGDESLNYVEEGQTSFNCWRCRDRQSVAEALTYPPQSWDDVLRAGFRPGGR